MRWGLRKGVHFYSVNSPLLVCNEVSTFLFKTDYTLASTYYKSCASLALFTFPSTHLHVQAILFPPNRPARLGTLSELMFIQFTTG